MKSGAYTYVNPAVDPNAGNRAAKFVQNMDFERFAATDAEMQGAEMLLADSTSSVSEVATYCGFDSPSNFTKMFKRFYNCTPREYRRIKNPLILAQ